MLYNNINQITEKEILELIENSVSESLYLEYKREIKFSIDADKKELLSDVCSFANSEGGIIIYGIEEDANNQGAPSKAINLQIHLDETITCLNESIRKNFEPGLIGVKIESRQVQDKTLLVVFIPKSSDSPHRVVFKNSRRFWKRAGSSKYEIPIEELRKDFLQGAELSKRISEFRSERITKILSNETPVIFHDNNLPKLVLHIIPINFFDNQKALNMSDLPSSSFYPPVHENKSFSDRFNFDGRVFYDLMGMSTDMEKSNSYTQIFRNSAIEFLYSAIARNRKLYLITHEKIIIEIIKKYSKSVSQKSINGSCLVFLSLLNVKGYEIYKEQSELEPWNRKTKIERDNLLLPDVYLEDINNFKPEIMKSVFDLVWNACNYSGSQNYDKKGNWKPK